MPDIFGLARLTDELTGSTSAALDQTDKSGVGTSAWVFVRGLQREIYRFHESLRYLLVFKMSQCGAPALNRRRGRSQVSERYQPVRPGSRFS
jgi:hypothetical protein